VLPFKQIVQGQLIGAPHLLRVQRKRIDFHQSVRLRLWPVAWCFAVTVS